MVPKQVNKADVATICTLVHGFLTWHEHFCAGGHCPNERLLFSLPNLALFHISFPVVGLRDLPSIVP